MEPGYKRVSLDHRVPRARGGDDTIENLRWVSFAANRAKSALTDEEFLEMCRRVVATLGVSAPARKDEWTTPPTRSEVLSN